MSRARGEEGVERDRSQAPGRPVDARKWPRVGDPTLGAAHREGGLEGVNPFRLAAEGLLGKVGNRALLTIVATGVHIADQDDLVILASPSMFSAEGVIDQACRGPSNVSDSTISKPSTALLRQPRRFGMRDQRLSDPTRHPLAEKPQAAEAEHSGSEQHPS
jgi:hypothetical protein